jgi:hypothetical protein
MKFSLALFFLLLMETNSDMNLNNSTLGVTVSVQTFGTVYITEDYVTVSVPLPLREFWETLGSLRSKVNGIRSSYWPKNYDPVVKTFQDKRTLTYFQKTSDAATGLELCNQLRLAPIALENFSVGTTYIDGVPISLHSTLAISKDKIEYVSQFFRAKNSEALEHILNAARLGDWKFFKSADQLSQYLRSNFMGMTVTLVMYGNELMLTPVKIGNFACQEKANTNPDEFSDLFHEWFFTSLNNIQEEVLTSLENSFDFLSSTVHLLQSTDSHVQISPEHLEDQIRDQSPKFLSSTELLSSTYDSFELFFSRIVMSLCRVHLQQIE